MDSRPQIVANEENEEENHLPNLHFWVQNVNFQGCTLW